MTRPGERRNRGQISENFVKNYILKKYKYLFLDANYTTKSGEIDMIFKCNRTDLIIFFEGRSFSVDSCNAPEETISLSKKKKIIRTAKMYLMEKFQSIDIPSRFDIAAVIFTTDENAEIDYFEDAFGENW